QRLLQIQGIISVMIANITIDNDLQTKKDGIRLEKINLTSDEWDAISLLTAILKPFAEATELLGGSKYATISFMYSAITVIEQGFLLFSKTSNMNFYSANDVFEDDVIYDDDNRVQEDHTSNRKQRRININNLQNCTNLEEKIKSALYDAMVHYWNVPSNEAMLATLLDPRCKPLSFMSESLKNKTIELLKTKYEESRVIYRIKKNDNLQSQSNSLITSMFNNRYPRLEVLDYLGAQEILWDQCPLTWWRTNQKWFPVLSKLARKYLAIPATSTASERLFSDARNTITEKRISLLPTTFEHLVFLRNNWQITGDMFP
ncbi:22262_t:CDS:1, partial [Racocetra persica]